MRPEKQRRYVLFAVKTAGEEQEVIPRCTSPFGKLLLVQIEVKFKFSVTSVCTSHQRVTNESP